MRRTGQQPLPHVVTKEWLFERASEWPAGAVMREQWGQELTSASVPDGAPLPTLSGRPGRLLPEVALACDSGGLSCCPHCEETQRWAASAPRRVTCRPTAPAVCRAASEVVGTSRGPSGAALGWAVHTASGSPRVPGCCTNALRQEGGGRQGSYFPHPRGGENGGWPCSGPLTPGHPSKSPFGAFLAHWRARASSVVRACAGESVPSSISACSRYVASFSRELCIVSVSPGHFGEALYPRCKGLPSGRVWHWGATR